MIEATDAERARTDAQIGSERQGEKASRKFGRGESG